MATLKAFGNIYQISLKVTGWTLEQSIYQSSHGQKHRALQICQKHADKFARLNNGIAYRQIDPQRKTPVDQIIMTRAPGRAGDSAGLGIGTVIALTLARQDLCERSIPFRAAELGDSLA
jgi:hypothetical protein